MESAMRAYEIMPKVGIGPVRLGALRNEVHAVMGSAPHRFMKTPQSKHPTEAWHNRAFHVYYCGPAATVEFIEVAQSDEFVALYKGVDVHRTKADELVAYVARDTPFDRSDRELGYAYVFPAIELSLWRAVMPKSADDPDGQFFEAVGLGIRGYFSNPPP
jgi:hypothetical protein